MAAPFFAVDLADVLGVGDEVDAENAEVVVKRLAGIGGVRLAVGEERFVGFESDAKRGRFEFLFLQELFVLHQLECGEVPVAAEVGLGPVGDGFGIGIPVCLEPFHQVVAGGGGEHGGVVAGNALLFDDGNALGQSISWCRRRAAKAATAIPSGFRSGDHGELVKGVKWSAARFFELRARGGRDDEADVFGVRFEVGFADEVLGLGVLVPDHDHRLVGVENVGVGRADRAAGLCGDGGERCEIENGRDGGTVEVHFDRIAIEPVECRCDSESKSVGITAPHAGVALPFLGSLAPTGRFSCADPTEWRPCLLKVRRGESWCPLGERALPLNLEPGTRNLEPGTRAVGSFNA